jgi:hypothetical protein
MGTPDRLVVLVLAMTLALPGRGARADDECPPGITLKLSGLPRHSLPAHALRYYIDLPKPPMDQIKLYVTLVFMKTTAGQGQHAKEENLIERMIPAPAREPHFSVKWDVTDAEPRSPGQFKLALRCDRTANAPLVETVTFKIEWPNKINWPPKLKWPWIKPV